MISVRDFEIATAAAPAGFRIARPAAEPVEVMIPQELVAIAARGGIRLEPVAGFGRAAVRVHLPAGGGFFEVRGIRPAAILAELRAALRECTA